MLFRDIEIEYVHRILPTQKISEYATLFHFIYLLCQFSSIAVRQMITKFKLTKYDIVKG